MLRVMEDKDEALLESVGGMTSKLDWSIQARLKRFNVRVGELQRAAQRHLSFMSSPPDISNMLGYAFPFFPVNARNSMAITHQPRP